MAVHMLDPGVVVPVLVFGMTQLSIILGAPSGLLMCSIGLFLWGGFTGGVLGTALLVAALIVFAVYLVVHFRTRAMIRKAARKARLRDPSEARGRSEEVWNG